MKITEADLVGVNTFGIKFHIDDWGCIIIEEPEFNMWLNKRPYYCDRGRYGFQAEGKQGKIGEVDWADGFPRYFFALQNAFNEIYEYIKFNKEVKNV